jgi:TonB family protein
MDGEMHATNIAAVVQGNSRVFLIVQRQFQGVPVEIRQGFRVRADQKNGRYAFDQAFSISRAAGTLEVLHDEEIEGRVLMVAWLSDEIARASRSKRVRRSATIDAEGNVADARVVKSVPLLDQAALDAVRQWHYQPTLLNGVPTAVVTTVTVKFTLQ